MFTGLGGKAVPGRPVRGRRRVAMLMQGTVQSDSMKGLLEDAATPASVAAMAMMAMRQQWDQRIFRPEDGDAADGE